MNTMLSIILGVIVAGLIFYVLWWGLGKLALPEPFHKVATVVLVVATVLVLINLLLGLLGQPLFRW